MAGELFKKITQTATVLGLIAVPLYGGQVVASAAKAKVTAVRNAAASSRPVEFLVDLGGGAIMMLPTLGLAAAIGSKGAWLRAMPFVLAGVIFGATLAPFDSVIDGWVNHLLGTGAAGAGAGASSQPAPGGRRSSSGRRSATLRALPGGRRDTVYKRSEHLKVPGGGLTIEANQADPVALSKRLRVKPRR